MPERPTLRERIKADFDIDLPITGGSGTREAPFLVEAPDAQEATRIQAALMRCQGIAREEAWRWLGQDPVPHDTDLVLLRVERVIFDESQVVTETSRYYFRWSLEVPLDSAATLPSPAGILDGYSGIYFPYELGWMHLTTSTDHEVSQPGLGVGIEYGGLGIKGTLFAYDLGEPVLRSDQSRLDGEFLATVQGITKSVPDAVVIQSDRICDSTGEPRWLLALLGMPDELLSAVVVGTKHDRFIKARITWQASDARSTEIGHECVLATLKAFD